MQQEVIHIENRAYWIKVVEMLQHNWALIEEDESNCTVYFVSDTSIVFDRLSFNSTSDAKIALRRNSFSLYKEETDLQDHISSPEPPFYEVNHPNGPIYSSGRFWN